MTTQKQPALPARQPSLKDVLDRARKARESTLNGSRQSASEAPPDWDALNSRLYKAVEVQANMAALNAVGRPQHEGFGESAQGLAALVSALKGSNGENPTGPLLQLMSYMQKRDTDSLVREITEIKHGMQQTGNPVLDTLMALRELGVVGGKEAANPALEMLSIMKDLGLLSTGQPRSEPQSFISQLDQMLNIMDRLRPQQQPSMIQLPNGITGLSFEQLLGLQKASSEERLQRERTETQREFIQTLRSGIGEIAQAFGEQAVELAAERAAPAPKRTTQTRRSATAMAVCDFCSAENVLENVDPASPPSSFLCSSCSQENIVEAARG